MAQAPVDADGTSRALVAAWRRRHRAEAELAAAEAAQKAAPHSQVVARLRHRYSVIGSLQVCCWHGARTKPQSASALCQAVAQRVAAAEAVLDGDLEFALANTWDDEESDHDADDGQQEPPSFSKIDLSLPDALLRKRFPGFPVRRSLLPLGHRCCAACAR